MKNDEKLNTDTNIEKDECKKWNLVNRMNDQLEVKMDKLAKENQELKSDLKAIKDKEKERCEIFEQLSSKNEELISDIKS